MESATLPNNVIDVSEHVSNGQANGQTDTQANGQATNGTDEAKKSRWSETNHVFATPHPAHELISCQTAYGRDMKDEQGIVTDKKPEGFDRIMLPNLLPSNRIEEAERLCRIHGVDLRDEWRYAQLQMTEAIIKHLSELPIPETFKDTAKKLGSAEREAKRAAKAESQETINRLREEGKALRAKLKEEKDKQKLVYHQKIAEAQGKPIPQSLAEIEGATNETDKASPNGTEPDSTGSTLGLQTLGNAVPPPAPPTPQPTIPNTTDGQNESPNVVEVTAKPGTESQEVKAKTAKK